MPIKTYSGVERQEKIESALELRYNERSNWEEIATKIDVARSTLNEWRKSDEWKEADARWRKLLREQTRGDLSQMGDEAVAVLYELMKTDKSGYVRFSAAAKILELNQVGNEIEEQVADQQKELNDFLLKEAKRRQQEAQHYIVEAGGLLPKALQEKNEAYRAKKVAEQQALEAEFHISEGQIEDPDE